MKTLIAAGLYIAANAVGLLIATLVLTGFRIDFLSFLFVVVVFSLILAVLTPVIRKASEKWMPALVGGLALVVIFFGLRVTEWLMAGMEIGGLTNWIAATVLVWIGSLVAGAILPRLIGRSKPTA